MAIAALGEGPGVSLPAGCCWDMNTSIPLHNRSTEHIQPKHKHKDLWPSKRVLRLIGHLERHVPDALAVEHVHPGCRLGSPFLLALRRMRLEGIEFLCSYFEVGPIPFPGRNRVAHRQVLILMQLPALDNPGARQLKESLLLPLDVDPL